MKYKVTFQLMVEPSKGDEVFNKSYTVDADKEREALDKAEILKDADYDNQYGFLNKRSVFNYSIKNLDYPN